MKRKYTIRYDRIAAVLIIICIPLVIFLMPSKESSELTSEDFPTSLVSEKVESSSSPVSGNSSVVSVNSGTETVTTTQPVSLPYIDYPDCSSAVLYSAYDRQILYSDSINERVAPASLTKLVTAAVALKYADISDIYTVGSEQWLVQPYSSLCYIQIGNELTLYDLITGMLMASGNDAAYTIAVSVARDISSDIYLTDDEALSYFCGLMNDFAYDLGMTSSNFVNPDGWDDDEQFTTVSDMLKISEYILGLPEIREIVGTYQKSVTIYSGEVFNWTNSNLLLDPYSDYYCEYAVGMKTGTTLNAGHNLIAVFHKNDKTYISVVTGCQSDTDRYDLTLKMLSLA